MFMVNVDFKAAKTLQGTFFFLIKNITMMQLFLKLEKMV